MAVKDGKCRVVSSSSLAQHADANIGSGVVLSADLISMRLVENTIYGIVGSAVMAVDVSTGARRLVSASDTQRLTGKGDGIGGGWLSSPVDGKTFFTFGAQWTPTTTSSSVVTTVGVDATTGDRTEHLALGGPLDAGGAGTGIAHPTMPGVLIVAQLHSVALYEIATGNSMHLSY